MCAYFEVYGQLLPMHSLNDMLKTLLGIQSDYIEEGSFRLWAGIPAPRDGWLMMKLIFLHKLLTDRDGVDTLLHHWIDTGQLDEGSTIYQEMMIAQQTLLGHKVLDCLRCAL